MNTTLLRMLVGGGVGFLAGSYAPDLGLSAPWNLAVALVVGYIAGSLVQEPKGDD